MTLTSFAKSLLLGAILPWQALSAVPGGFEEAIEALGADDECLSTTSANSPPCAVNALQLSGNKIVEEAAAQRSHVENQEEQAGSGSEECPHTTNFGCTWSSTVGLTVSWPAAVDAKEYDVHIGFGRGAAPFLSQTSRGSCTTLQDLKPATEYTFTVYKVASVWPESWAPWVPHGRYFKCRTAPLKNNQAWVMPPNAADPDSISVNLDRDAPVLREGLSAYEIEWKLSGSSDAWQSEKFDPWQTVKINGLPASSVFDVRAFPVWFGSLRGMASEVVVHRTASESVSSFYVYRSAASGDEAGLTEKNAASLEAMAKAAPILALLKAIGQHGSAKAKELQPHTIMRYCVHKPADKPFADYTSCDKSKCRCMMFWDRCYVHASTDSCNPYFGGPGVTAANIGKLSAESDCNCSAEAANYSSHAVGRATDYSPSAFNKWSSGEVLPHQYGGPELQKLASAGAKIESCSYPEGTKYSEVGYRYSFPGPGQCPPGVSPASGQCGWSLSPSHSVISNHDLVGELTKDQAWTAGKDFSQVSAEAIGNLFKPVLANPQRCCGC
mmetsp:Transcript_58671/g.105432  ORF Transcript_58671/g.105432 Transcript_58671/m.105432 type:complete len:554 (-) Transcript_58671:310-1971(-)